jgi:anaerobic C4-dicarboxylate transporter
VVDRQEDVLDEGRDETRDERMDRNFNELLQELRVVQTGTQILAGFLLTLPFQARFTDLTDYHRAIFLVAISLAFLTTVLLVAPVSLHRLLFRRHRKDQVVEMSHQMARVGLVTLGLTLTTVLCLIFSVVVSDLAGWVAGAVAVVVFAGVWWALPTWLRSHRYGVTDDAG